jgi:ATP-dependent RNA helicase RhlE
LQPAAFSRKEGRFFMPFDDLGLDARLLDAVRQLGYDEPTPIQRDAIPLVLAGRDVVGCAQTGTGKTAAFVLPLLQRLGAPANSTSADGRGDAGAAQRAADDHARGGRRRRRGRRGRAPAVKVAAEIGAEPRPGDNGTGPTASEHSGNGGPSGNGNGGRATTLASGQNGGNGRAPARSGPRQQRDSAAADAAQAPSPSALVVTPTRELAAQIEEVAFEAAQSTGHRVLAVYGGVPYEPQAKKARRGVDVLVATPGRLLDLLHHHDVELSEVRILVLDEADRMLDMGFWPDVRRIVRALPAKRQNLLFSATMSRAVLDVIGDALNRPVHVQVGERATPVENVEQVVYPVDAAQKTDLLVEFLRHHRPERALIFTRTKFRAERLSHALTHKGIKGTAIHGNRTQQQREQALDGFKRGRYNALVATDVVARGIDVEGITHVINYDIPANPEDYVHRIGRTARAGASGTAVSFLTAEEVHELKAIERLIGATLEREDLDGFEYAKRDIPHSDDVPRKPGRLVWNGGARRAAQRGFRRVGRPRVVR